MPDNNVYLSLFFFVLNYEKCRLCIWLYVIQPASQPVCTIFTAHSVAKKKKKKKVNFYYLNCFEQFLYYAEVCDV